MIGRSLLVKALDEESDLRQRRADSLPRHAQSYSGCYSLQADFFALNTAILSVAILGHYLKQSYDSCMMRMI